MWNPIFDRVDVVGIAVVSLDGIVDQCNDTFARFLQDDRANITGKHVVDLTAEEHRDRTRLNLQYLTEGHGEEIRHQKHYVTPFGDDVPVRLQSMLIRDDDRNPWYLLSFVVETTGRESFQELQTRNKQLEDLLATVLKSQSVTVNMVNNDNSQTATADNQATASITRTDHNAPPVKPAASTLNGTLLGLILAAMLAVLWSLLA